MPCSRPSEAPRPSTPETPRSARTASTSTGAARSLKRLYPEAWIVIARGRVAAHGATPDEAARIARERGESLACALVRHLPTEERAWLL